MRRMLQSTHYVEVADGASKRTGFGHVAACLLVMLTCWNEAHAQTWGNYPISSTTMNLGSNPVSSGGQLQIVDASYVGNKKSPDVQKAQYVDDGTLGSFGGVGGLGDAGYNALYHSECQPGAYSCVRCDIDWYFNAEMLAFRREGDRRFTLTQNAFMDRGDFELGTRATIGRMYDCANAIEFVYVGPFDWTRSSVANGTNNIDSRFVTFVGSTLADAFNNSNQHVQTWRQRSNSFEVNRRRWAWDSVSTLIGVRYFNYEERYNLLASNSAAPLTAEYRDQVENHLIGAQIGGDLFFTTSLRTSISLRGKAGVYANFGEHALSVAEDGATVLVNGSDKVDVAGLFELGVYGNYQITPSVRFNVGYEAWIMPGMATITEQAPHILIPDSGTVTSLEDNLFFHGFNVGVQILH